MEIFTITGKNYDSNIFVILGKIPTLIDTGTGLYSNKILATLEKFIAPEKVQQIILTHEHYDHVGGTNDILQVAHQAQVVAHRSAISKLRSGESSFARILGGSMPKIQVTAVVQGGEQLHCGDEKFTVLYTPGHSLGSISLYSPSLKALFCGDVIFAQGNFGRYDLPGGDYETLKTSIQSLSALEVKDVYPGHGPNMEVYGKDQILKSLYNIQHLM